METSRLIPCSCVSVAGSAAVRGSVVQESQSSTLESEDSVLLALIRLLGESKSLIGTAIQDLSAAFLVDKGVEPSQKQEPT